MGKDSLKLMIVDDNERFRNLVRQILATPEDHVLEIADGSKVCENYAAFQPDWVLMDVNMKPVDGLEAAQHLLSEFSDAKVIFLSNFTNKKLVAKGLGLGAKAYVSKEDVFAIKDIIRPKALHTGENHANLIHH